MSAKKDDLHVVDANADKELFVSMLVRDIELLPAIMDLVDNSVDGARAHGKGNFAGFRVDITVDQDSFRIADNCGGIDLDVARKYAFRFGRPKAHRGVEGSVGQFGVGMKRALFKLGDHFIVESRTESTAFVLDVDVNAWLKDTSSEWHFTMSSVDPAYDGSKGVGTVIVVDGLHGTVADDFGRTLTVGSLREQVRLRHQQAIADGLHISLNGERLAGLDPQLLLGSNFSPINRRFVVNAGGGDVHCHLIAGVAPSSKRDDLLDDDNAENFQGTSDAGWWVFCNGRLLLFADRTELTGWGVASAIYHPQYRRFRGYVFMESQDSSLLPWNTTKTGVDQDSRVWRRVFSEMKTSLAEVLSVFNRLKTEGTDSESPLTKAVAEARPVKIRELPQSYAFVTPPRVRRVVQRPRVRKIQYDVDVARFRAVADALEVSTAADVGRDTFDYFFTREVRL